MGLWHKEERYCTSFTQIEEEEEGIKNCAYTYNFLCVNAHKYRQELNAHLTDT